MAPEQRPFKRFVENGGPKHKNGATRNGSQAGDHGVHDIGVAHGTYGPDPKERRNRITS